MPKVHAVLRSSIGICLLVLFAANAGVVNLRCEYLQDPLGIDVLKPRLSWEIESTVRGETQKSVQIIVASSQANIDANIGDHPDLSGGVQRFGTSV
jgi:alpha-L-rhamnosidase